MKTRLFFLFIFLGLYGVAQVPVTVSLKQNKDSSLATLVIYRLPDSVKINSRIIIDTARLFLQPKTSYYLTVQAVGKKALHKNFEVKHTALLVELNLVNDASTLESIVLVSKKPFIKQEDDKTIIDAEPLTSSSTNAYEVLEKTPGAVTLDGNVYLNSATPAIIQINGREVKMSADEVATMLKNLPANSIVKIEILRTPSAKYDASGAGGIINIVLKKGVKLGTSGSLNAEYAQGKYASGSMGFSLNNRSGKFNSNLSYNYSKRKSFELLESTRKGNTSNLAQDAYTVYPSYGHFIRAGIDYAANKKWTMGYSTRIAVNHNNSIAENNISILSDNSPALFLQSLALAHNKNKSAYFNNDFDLNYKIDSTGSEWSTSFTYNYYKTDAYQQYRNLVSFPPGVHDVLGNGDISGLRNYYITQTDFTWKKIPRSTIEAGGKMIINQFNNNALFSIDSTGTPVNDNIKTAQFIYKEQVSSLYLQVSRSFGNFTLKPGIRLEFTNLQGTQQIPYDTGFSIKRSDFFPYVFVKHPLFKIMGFQLMANAIFRKSISRPGYSMLNPAPVYVDPFLYNIGNPGIRPQFTTNYEFNINAEDYPIFAMGINKVKDIFTAVTYEDTATKIILNTYDNLGKNKEFYIRANGGIPPGGKYFFYIGSQYNHTHYEGFYQKKPFNYSNGSWLFYTYHNFKLKPSTSFSLFGFYRLKSLNNFYELQPFGMINFSVNQAILKKKANIILSFNDMFRTMKIDFTLTQGGIDAAGSRLNDNRKGVLKFIYNFGIKPKQEKQPVFGMPAENGTL